jgi:hypothetical protein
MALHLYGQLSATPRLDWDWVDAQLKAAGTYWVVARTRAIRIPARSGASGKMIISA